MENRKIIAIVGPTASGKTGVGVRLAKKIGGEIISADSRQIFRGLDIGSGKDLKEYDNVVYHLIDVAEPGERFTLFDWLARARSTIEDIFARGKTPIVVGGTGLYVSALVEGYQLEVQGSSSSSINFKSQIPNKYTRQELDNKSLEELQTIYGQLTTDNGQRKTNNGSLDLRNKRRIIRAIEKAQSGEEVEKIKPNFDSLVIGLDVDRQELYKRIDRRADERFAEGMLEETRSLLLCHPRAPLGGGPQAETLGIQRPLDSCLRRSDKNNSQVDPEMADWLISLGLDYKHMTQYLLDNGLDAKAKGLEFEKMVEKFKFAEHDYARRQLTWWRKKDVKWAKSYPEVEKSVSDFLAPIDKQLR